jgi:hypothetical protein
VTGYVQLIRDDGVSVAEALPEGTLAVVNFDHLVTSAAVMGTRTLTEACPDRLVPCFRDSYSPIPLTVEIIVIRGIVGVWGTTIMGENRRWFLVMTWGNMETWASVGRLHLWQFT